jgi:hypothetical protein
MFTELQQQKNNKLQIFKTDTIHQLEIAAETFVDYLCELHPVKGITPSADGRNYTQQTPSIVSEGQQPLLYTKSPNLLQSSSSGRAAAL